MKQSLDLAFTVAVALTVLWQASAIEPDTCLLDKYTGNWNATGNRPVWQHSRPGCRVDDGLTLTLRHNYSVLLLGDSLEREQLRDVCNLAYERGLNPHYQSRQLPEGVQPNEEHHLGYDSLLTCRLPAGYLQLTGFIMGVWPNGPYWLSHAHSDTSPLMRVVQAKKIFMQQWGDAPDIILINANFWDNFRFSHDQFGITSLDILEQWRAHFRTLLELVEEHFPSVRLKFYHTSITRVPNELLVPAVISDLNTAGASVALEAGWQVVDQARLIDSFQNYDHYLRDHHHPKPFILLALYDVYLSTAARLMPKSISRAS